MLATIDRGDRDRLHWTGWHAKKCHLNRHLDPRRACVTPGVDLPANRSRRHDGGIDSDDRACVQDQLSVCDWRGTSLTLALRPAVLAADPSSSSSSWSAGWSSGSSTTPSAEK